VIRFIDIETTGTDPQRDEIIEIASVCMVRGGGITNAMDTLVCPAGPIPPGASAVHHLIDEAVRNAPILTEVIGRFTGADFYVAHNAEFERGFFAAKASSSAHGSAPTNARSRSGRSRMATATRNCATRSAAPARFPASSAVPSRRTARTRM
jgi:DNA polymerase III epsilon subunit-like protein